MTKAARSEAQGVRYDRDEVLARVDLTALADSLLGPRHPRTRSWRCPNPAHSQTGRTPPVSIFVDRRGLQRWHCHGCGDGGTAIDLTMRVGSARDFRDALEWLAGHAHVSPLPDDWRPVRRPPAQPAPAPARPDAAARHALDAYAKGCADHLHSTAGLDVRRWLVDTRGLPEHVLDHAGVGADPGMWKLPRPDGIPKISPAAVFPVRHRGEVVFTLSRAIRPLRDLPRWVNTATSVAPNPRVALLEPPAGHPAGPLIVTEGMIDALSALSAGRSSAALLGTGVIDDAIADRLASVRRPLLLATDNDTAGHRAREQLLALLRGQGAAVNVLTIPDRFNDLNDWHIAAPDHWPQTLAGSIRLTSIAREPNISPPAIA